VGSEVSASTEASLRDRPHRVAALTVHLVRNDTQSSLKSHYCAKATHRFRRLARPLAPVFEQVALSAPQEEAAPRLLAPRRAPRRLERRRKPSTRFAAFSCSFSCSFSTIVPPIDRKIMPEGRATYCTQIAVASVCSPTYSGSETERTTQSEEHQQKSKK